MGMKKIWAFCLLLFCLAELPAQIIQIKHFENGEPLEGVTILSNEPKAFAVTNLYGKADISSFKGAKLILIRSLAFENKNLSFQQLDSLNFQLLLEPSNLQLDEVVVSANRWRQSAADVPSKITSISPQEVALQNPQTAADLLGISGKVFIQKSQQGGGSPMIRGFATNRLIYTVDGVRMNTAIFRGGNIQNVINLDPFATEKTEVLFGPGSVIYGSDAIGGVMSFQTYEPQFSLTDKTTISGKAASRFSSANQEKTVHLDFNIGWKKWASFTSFTNWNYDDLRQGRHGPSDYLKAYHVERRDGEDVVIAQNDKNVQSPSAYTQTNIMQKIRFQPNKNWDFTYAFHYSETSEYGRYDRHNRLRNGLPRYGEWNYGPQSWMMNQLSIENHSENLVYNEMYIRLAHQNFEESRISRNFNSSNREIREENVEAISLNIDFNKSQGNSNTIFYGIELVNNAVGSKGIDKNIDTGVETNAANRYPQADWSSAAIFISDEYHLTEKVSLQGGLRYNLFLLEADFTDNLAFYPFPYETTKIENSATTGSFGAVFRPNDKWVFKSNFGTAFRSPNVDDLGKVFDSEPGSVVIPNPDLNAEYAYNIDFGFAKVFGNFLKLDLTGYYTILENAMVRRDFLLNGKDSLMFDGVQSKVQALQNAAEARVYGLQAGLELKFNNYLSISSDFNYQLGEEELDNGDISASRHAAPYFGINRITYQRQRTRVQFYMEFQGERKHEDLAVEEQSKEEIYALDSKGKTYAPAWYTLNLKVQQSIAENFTLAAGMENIADVRYRPYSSGISATGRNLFLSLTAKF